MGSICSNCIIDKDCGKQQQLPHYNTDNTGNKSLNTSSQLGLSCQTKKFFEARKGKRVKQGVVLNTARQSYHSTLPKTSMHLDETTRTSVSTAVYEISHSSEKVSADSFHAIKVVGRGSFGKVYLVQKKDSGEYFAMKSLKKEVVLKRKQKESTCAERLILEKVDSPFVVKLHYAFQTNSRLYFVMDFLNGGDIFYHLRREQRFSEERARFYAAEILLGLQCLHG